MSETKAEIEHLLQQMKSGSVSAFDQFYERYIPLVFRIARRMMGDSPEAEDLCHDVFLEVWEKIDLFDSQRGSLESWLAVITRNRCLDRLRKKQRWKTQELEDQHIETAAGAPSMIEDDVVARMLKENMREALKNLPDSQRQVLYGMYYEHKSQRELSQSMNRPLGTIKSLIKYGVNNVRKQLNRLGWLEASGGVEKHD